MNKKPPLRVAIPILTPEPYSPDATHAVIELNPARIKLITNRLRKVKAAKKKDEDLYKVEYWDDVEYYTLTSHVEEANEGTLQVLDYEPPAEKLCSVDAIRMVLTVDGTIYWAAYEKHASIRLDTEGVQVTELIDLMPKEK